MRKVSLVFPDSSTLTDFIFTYKIHRAEVASAERKLTAVLSEEQIVVACTVYEAELNLANVF